ncbi:beta-1,6-N-acetylglucosaminyltransferase [Microvirga flavescens]|uniref:beta-1,6-N-acetylglucosaminyltransferase n=1 Tax=Microvirga flavescens TaxID=2249811 RepID=UPI000DDC0856|nr:beta-1,6-N-acetylglucosaminyltransferase [Microvirga flavescens]
MKKTIAILVLANAQVGSLRKFAREFDPERYRFYVHLDARRDMAAYLGDEPMPEHVRFVENRLPIFWGGFNMIRATEILANEALKDEAHFAFSLVSDDSFPLLADRKLYEAISTQPLRIDTWAIGPEHAHYPRYSRFFDFDCAHGSPRYLAVEERYIQLSDFDRYERLRRLMERGKSQLSIYAGSQWWTLPRDILQECLACLHDDANLRESFEFSAIPDEIVFQTLTRRLVEADRAIPGTGMVYDFARDPKPFVFSRIDELKPDLINGRLFIRKVVPDDAFLSAILELNQ